MRVSHVATIWSKKAHLVDKMNTNLNYNWANLFMAPYSAVSLQKLKVGKTLNWVKLQAVIVYAEQEAS